jgi:DNA-binding CsgD family transcriptional regulator
MIRLAVLSRSDAFHRQIWNAAKERPNVRVELRLRSVEEAGGLREIDVLVVHGNVDSFPPPADPHWFDFPPIVFVGYDAPPTDADRHGEPRSFVAEDAEPQRIIVAAEATANGFVVVDPAYLALRPSDSRQPTPSAAPAAASLTERETEVLVLLASGKTNQQIAVELGITNNTVKFHLAGIYGALDVSTRAEAVVAAIRGGLISM